MLVERDTGIILNQAGHRQLRGQPKDRPCFDDEGDALRLKDALLQLLPWSTVSLTDAHAGPGTPPRTFCPDDTAIADYEALKAAHTAYLLANPLRRAFLKPPLDPWSPTSYSILREERRSKP
jgi:hypothetical protein